MTTPSSVRPRHRGRKLLLGRETVVVDGTSGGRPPVAATSVRSASIVRPSVRLIDRSDAPARYARQISAFSGTVNADRTIITTSVAHEQASPVRQGDAFIP